MPSNIWMMTPSEAYQNPYNYDDQAAFIDEAERILKAAHAVFSDFNMTFGQDEETLEKAIWLMQFDALNALIDCVHLLRDKRHDTVRRLFRDVFETLDLAAYFAGKTAESDADLKRWYQDEILTHSRYRNALKKVAGEAAAKAKAKAKEYTELSHFAHRSYLVIRNSYAVGKNDLLWHDSVLRSHGASMPQPIAEAMAVLGHFILVFLRHVEAYGVVDNATLKNKAALAKAIIDVFRVAAKPPNA